MNDTYTLTPEAKALMKRLAATKGAIEKARAAGESTGQLTQEGSKLLEDGLLSLGFNPAELRRVRAFCDEDSMANGSDVLTALRDIAAVGLSTQFAPFSALAHVALDELVEVAKLARRMDLRLGSIDLDTGAGALCPFPALLDADVIGVSHYHIDGANNEAGHAIMASIGKVMSTMEPDAMLAAYGPITLMGLIVLGPKVAKALAPLTMFAAAGNLKTAAALKHVFTEQAVAAAIGKALNEKRGEEHYYWFDALREANSKAMLEALDYILTHGSDEGFDAKGERAKLDALARELGPEAEERVRHAKNKAARMVADHHHAGHGAFHASLKS